jgi:L-lactate dehydrogenase
VIPLEAFPVPAGTTLAEIKAQCEGTTRRRGGDIHARKGFTSYGVAAAACRLVDAILRDEGRIFTVSARALPDYGIGATSCSACPAPSGRGGITRRLVLSLNTEERQQLEKSAAVLTTARRSVP